MYFSIKILLSALLIYGVSEVSKHSPFWGGVLASLPMISVLAMVWLFQETQDIQLISRLSYSIFWMVLPSLVLFLALPVLLKYLPFYPALLLSCSFTAGAYVVLIFALSKLGILIK
jgi:hypothetical protein